MNFRHQEIVDWGIIRYQWVGEIGDYEVILEKHEEDRFTVHVRHKNKDISYYSYWSYNGSRTFDSLEAAAAFAEQVVNRFNQGDYSGCDGEDAPK